MKNLGLQIYTVIDLLEKEENIDSVIKRIKDVGYGCIQLCSTVDFVKKVAPVCEKYNLPIMGYLSDINTLENNADEIFELAKKIRYERFGNKLRFVIV